MISKAGQSRDEALYDEARSLADQGDFGRAEILAGLLLESAPDDIEGLLLMGLISRAQGKPESAAEFYRKVLYLEPTHRDALMHYSLFLEQKGDENKAAALRKRLVRLDMQRKDSHGG